MHASSDQPISNPSQILPDKFDSSKRMWRNDVYESLESAGMGKIAERWLTCSDEIKTKIRAVPGAKLPSGAKTIKVCTGDHHHDAIVYSQSCDLRICPDCARMHSARFMARFAPKCIELVHQHHKTYRFRHITLTTPFCLTDKDARKRLLKGFKQVEATMTTLLGAAATWHSEQGYIAAAEFGEQGLKLHFHLLHYGKYLHQPDIVNAWRLATGGSAEIIFVRGLHKEGRVIEDEIYEVLKYATKFYSKNHETGEISYLKPELMPALATVLEKTRRIRAYGVFYKLPEPDAKTHTCSQCESPMIGIPVTYFEIYCNTGFLPWEFSRARRESLLKSRPADNSTPLTGALSPPNNQNPIKKQESLPFMKNVRTTKYD